MNTTALFASLARAQTWMDKARCRTIDLPPKERADIMFEPEHAAEGKAVCALCPVRLNCLAFALQTEDSEGIYGGHTWAERLSMCPICYEAKEPTEFGCSPMHSLMRLAELRDLEGEGDPDVHLTQDRSGPSVRTNPYCPRPRGMSHTSSNTYREGCRCAPARRTYLNRRNELQAAREEQA